MATDKKVQQGKLRFVLPKSLGEVAIVDDVDDAQLIECLEASMG